VTFCAIAGPPVVYNYGSNIVIENNYVYVDGKPTVTAQEYAEEATQMAAIGRNAEPAKTEEWQSLGVFGMVGNRERARQWYARADQLGHPTARDRLKSLEE